MTSMHRFLDQITSLPTLPSAVSRLYALLQNQNTSASDLEKVIKPDAALTANLLRMANSSFFGLPRQVTSIRQAIMLLGFKRVFEAATSASFLRLIPQTLTGYNISAASFWLHCSAVAILGERLAQELKLSTPDLIFTAGLIHDMGKLIICTHLHDPEAIRHQITNQGLDIIQAEQAVLGTDHAELGEALGAKWNLPRVVTWAARWHHTPSEAPPEVEQLLVDLIHTADALAHILGFGMDSGELSRHVDEAVIKRLGIKVQRLEVTASEAMEQIQELSQIFLAPVGGQT